VRQVPWIVSLGSEKNFREFTIRLGSRGSAFTPDQEYFEQLVAKAILFRRTERIVGSRQLGGYRAQTVTYTIAKLLHATQQRLDLVEIWRLQDLPARLADTLDVLGPLVHAKLLQSAGTQNIGEWAKKEACWKQIIALEWDLPVDFAAEIEKASGVTERPVKSSASIDSRFPAGERAFAEAVIGAGSETWFALRKWAKETGTLEGWQRGLAYSLGRLASEGREPSPKQATQGASILAEATRLGFQT
jgi:hypothetical protein